VLRGGIVIGQQPVAQLRVAVGQEAHLERLGERFDRLGAAEHGRHDDQGARLGGNAVAVVHARQRLRLDEQRDDPVGERDRELAAREHETEREQRFGPPRPGDLAVDLEPRAHAENEREHADAAARVERQRVGVRPARECGRSRQRGVHGALEPGAAGAEGVKPTCARRASLAPAPSSPPPRTASATASRATSVSPAG
jgi:hypothetical protein